MYCLSLDCLHLKQHIMVKWCSEKVWDVTTLLQHCITMMCLLGSIALSTRVFSFLRSFRCLLLHICITMAHHIYSWSKTCIFPLQLQHVNLRSELSLLIQLCSVITTRVVLLTFYDSKAKDQRKTCSLVFQSYFQKFVSLVVEIRVT